MQGDFVSIEAASWSNLAARAVRVILARKDIGYTELADLLSVFGITEGDRALASRVSLGRVKLSLLLQIMQVTNAEIPPLWADAMLRFTTWEERASAIVMAELEQIPPMDIGELVARLGILDAGFSSKTLISQISTGTISLPIFLRCLVTLRSRSLDFYLDYKDMIAAGKPCSGRLGG